MSFGKPATKFEIDPNDPSVCLEKLKYACSHEKNKKNILLFANQLLEIVGRGGSSKFSPCLFLSYHPPPSRLRFPVEGIVCIVVYIGQFIDEIFLLMQ